MQVGSPIEGPRELQMKVTSIVGMGIAYVLGAKAGRERYDQIRGWLTTAGDSPAMRDAKRKVKDAGGAVAGQARDKAAEGISNAVTGVVGSLVSSGGNSSSRNNSSSRGRSTSSSRSNSRRKTSSSRK
jgi:hypothetical protein